MPTDEQLASLESAVRRHASDHGLSVRSFDPNGDVRGSKAAVAFLCPDHDFAALLWSGSRDWPDAFTRSVVIFHEEFDLAGKNLPGIAAARVCVAAVSLADVVWRVLPYALGKLGVAREGFADFADAADAALAAAMLGEVNKHRSRAP